MAVSPANGWHSYYESHHHRGSASASTPPFGPACPLTLAAGRGQRLNLTVLSMGQYGIHGLDLGDSTLETISVLSSYQG